MSVQFIIACCMNFIKNTHKKKKIPKQKTKKPQTNTPPKKQKQNKKQTNNCNATQIMKIMLSMY